MTNDHNPDDYVQPSASEADGEYGTDEPAVGVEPPAGEAPAEPTAEDTSEKDELEAPNNVHTNPNVALRFVPYKVIERKEGGAITITPKRSTKIKEVQGGWDDSKASVEDYMFIAAFGEGLQAQLTASYVKGADGKLKAFFDRIIEDPEAHWTQGIEVSNGDILYGRRPAMKLGNERRNISGALARERNMRSLGLGLGARKYLPHTGIHIDVAPRSTSEYLDLDAQLALAKAEAGRESIGLIFQNSQVSQVRLVWDFIRRSIKWSNVQHFSKDTGDVDLGDVIRATDLPMLYWAQVCTMFPDGYPLDLPCSSGVNICKHIERVLFDVDKGLWVNTAKLTTAQIERLHNSAHLMSSNDLELYQNNSLSPLTREIKVNDTTKMILEIPTINQYIQSGVSWMAELTAGAEELFTGDKADPVAIATHITKQIERSVIREYSHWVREIIYFDKEAVAGADDIAECLGDMSTYSENLTVDVMGEIQKFIEDSTLAIIAIPNFACPICEKEHVSDEHSQHPDLIPIDMLRHFFMAKDLRVNIPTQR